MSVKLGIISLGCDKNRVDTENLLAYAATPVSNLRRTKTKPT